MNANDSPPPRIGVFGGSFDPVHLGHLWIAEAALESLELNQVRWIPAFSNPLKPRRPIASDRQRVEMLRLAIAGHPKFILDERELTREKVSYTVETLAELHAESDPARLFLILGADSLACFRDWKEPARLLELATIAVVRRGGEAAPDFEVLESLAGRAHAAEARRSVVSMPQIELSSSTIRRRVRAGRSIRYLVPRPVESFIAHEELYRGSDTTSRR